LIFGQRREWSKKIFNSMARTSQQNIHIQFFSISNRRLWLKIYSVEIIIAYKININSKIIKKFKKFKKRHEPLKNG